LKIFCSSQAKGKRSGKKTETKNPRVVSLALRGGKEKEEMKLHRARCVGEREKEEKKWGKMNSEADFLTERSNQHAV